MKVHEMIRKTSDAADLPTLQTFDAWHAKVASQLKEARTALRLSREELARRVGTRPGIIARFEDASHRGHSLAMLERIAKRMGLRLVVELTADEDTEAEDAIAAEWLKKHSPSKRSKPRLPHQIAKADRGCLPMGRAIGQR